MRCAVASPARIDEELAATGVHLRRERASGPEALTPAERRVAELAASGLTNREIGQTLFVSVKTVGTHLGHIYEKLDLQGPQAREQLAARLNGHAPPVSGPGPPPGLGGTLGHLAPGPLRASLAPDRPGPAPPPDDLSPDRPGPRQARMLDGAQRR